MIKEHKQFHIHTFPPHPCWPEGGFVLYEISADEIAKRIGFGKDGQVNFRDSWSGYVGIFSTMEQVAVAIDKCVNA